jgi:DNA-binding transcriptional LysR family regulator
VARLERHERLLKHLQEPSGFRISEMEMHQVRYFLAVSREFNFTRAAEACCVSQPALTRAIRLLEDELGGELFRRERRLTHLTELGQRMMPILQTCEDSASSAKALVSTAEQYPATMAA